MLLSLLLIREFPFSPLLHLGLGLGLIHHFGVNAVNCTTSDNSRNLWKYFGLERFFPQKVLYLVYPTEDCLILYNIYTVHPTVQLQWTPEVFNIIVKKLCSSKSQYFYRLWILHWSDSKWNMIQLSTCKTMFIWEACQSCVQITVWFMKDVDYRIVYHCLYLLDASLLWF